MATLHEYSEVGVAFFERAPFRVVRTVAIRATADQVFSMLEDGDAWPLWVKAIKTVEWTSPKPFGVGTTRTVTMKSGDICEEVFIAWEPGRRMGFHFTRSTIAHLNVFAEDYVVTPTASGCTVTWTFAVEPKDKYLWIAKLVRPLFVVALGSVLRGMKKAAEARFA